MRSDTVCDSFGVYLEVDAMLLPGDSTHQASLEVLAKSSTAIHRMSPSIKQL